VDNTHLRELRRLAGISAGRREAVLPKAEPARTVVRVEESAPADLLLKIAKKHFDIDTLETRKSDRDDFHDVAVWSIKAALEAAYEAGMKAGKR